MNRDTLRKISILSGSILVVSGGAIAANIPAIAEMFPKIPLTVVEMLTTIPALFIIFSVLLSNQMAKKVGYKKTVLMGMAIAFISGLIPIFTQNFWLIFLSRATFGIGIGLFNSLLVSFISYFYEGDERAQLIGFQSAFEGLGGMTLTFIVGQLLKIHWKTSFFIYALGIPIFIFFYFFVPDISYKEMNPISNKKQEKIKTNKKSSSWSIVGYILLLLVTVCFYMTISVRVTTLITTIGYGNATNGSNVLSLIGVGAMSAGFLFGHVYKILKKYTIPVAFTCMAAALSLIGYSNSVFLTGLGGMLCGLAFRTFIPYLFNKVNNMENINANFATSLLLMGFNLGSAFSPSLIALMEKIAKIQTPRGIFYLEASILVVFSLVSVTFITVKSRKSSIIEA